YAGLKKPPPRPPGVAVPGAFGPAAPPFAPRAASTRAPDESPSPRSSSAPTPGVAAGADSMGRAGAAESQTPRVSGLDTPRPRTARGRTDYAAKARAILRGKPHAEPGR